MLVKLQKETFTSCWFCYLRPCGPSVAKNKIVNVFCNVYVAVNFLFQVILVFPLFYIH